MSIRTLDHNGESDHRSENAARLIRSYTAKQGQYLAFIYYLLEDPPMFTVGSRHAAVFPGVAASGPSEMTSKVVSIRLNSIIRYGVKQACDK